MHDFMCKDSYVVALQLQVLMLLVPGVAGFLQHLEQAPLLFTTGLHTKP